jgi:hypothetical protein
LLSDLYRVGGVNNGPGVMPGEIGVGRALTSVGDAFKEDALAKDYAAITGDTADEASRLINAVGANRVNDYAKVQLVMALMRLQEEAVRARRHEYR